MKMKKIIAMGTATLLMLFFTVNFNVMAYDDTSYFNSLETISEEDCPDGIVPIEFENEEDFNDYCEMIENSNKVIIIDSTKSSTYDKSVHNNNKNNNNNFYLSNAYVSSYSGNYTGNYTTKKDLIKVGVSITSLNLSTNYTYQKDKTVGPIQLPRYKITNAYCMTTLTGYTIGMEIYSKSGICTIYPNDTCTSICTCTINQYLLINGAIKLFSTNYTLQHTFKVIS